MAHETSPRRSLHTSSLVVACAMVLLCAAVTQSRAAPTVAQIKAELKQCRAAVQRLPQYKASLQLIDEMLKSSRADLLSIANTTLLIPTTKGLYALGSRTLYNVTAMYYISGYNVLTKRYTYPQLSAAVTGAKLNSMLPGVPVQVYPKIQGRVVLGKVGGALKARAAVLMPDLCKGVFLKGHGTSLYIKPPRF